MLAVVTSSFLRGAAKGVAVVCVHVEFRTHIAEPRAHDPKEDIVHGETTYGSVHKHRSMRCVDMSAHVLSMVRCNIVTAPSVAWGERAKYPHRRISSLLHRLGKILLINVSIISQLLKASHNLAFRKGNLLVTLWTIEVGCWVGCINSKFCTTSIAHDLCY